MKIHKDFQENNFSLFLNKKSVSHTPYFKYTRVLLNLYVHFTLLFNYAILKLPLLLLVSKLKTPLFFSKMKVIITESAIDHQKGTSSSNWCEKLFPN